MAQRQRKDYPEYVQVAFALNGRMRAPRAKEAATGEADVETSNRLTQGCHHDLAMHRQIFLPYGMHNRHTQRECSCS